MRPPFGHEAQSYIRAANPDNSIEVDLTDLADDQEDVITQPYSPFDRAVRLEILSSHDPNEDTLPSAAFEPEPSPWKGAVTGFAHSWGISLLASLIILALAFESTCSK